MEKTSNMPVTALLAAGALVVAIGIALLWLPGPALPVLALGAILVAVGVALKLTSRVASPPG